MQRVIFLFTVGFLILINSGASPTFGLVGQAFAQPKEVAKKAPQDGPAARRMKKLFQSRASKVTESCNIEKTQKLISELESTRKLLAKQIELRRKAKKPKDPIDLQNFPRSSSDLKNAELLTSGYINQVKGNCSPNILEVMIIDAKNACRPDISDRLLAQFRRVVTLYRDRYEAAKALGNKSKIKPRVAELEYLGALDRYEWANNYKMPRCTDKKDTGDADTGGETVNLPDISGPVAEPALGLNDQGALDERRRIEENSAWLLGDWKYKAWRGGTTNAVLRFKLEGDGTISGMLMSTTPEMEKKGYQPRMILLRGIRDTSHKLKQPAAIWSYSANVAEIFSPRDPKRKPGQIYGQAEWKKGGVIYLEKKTSELGGSTGFGNRLNWHRDKLLRAD